MTRPVICIDLNNNNQRVDDSFCDPNTEPARSVSCGSGPCATGWRKGPWSKVNNDNKFHGFSYIYKTVLQNMPNWTSDAYGGMY